MRPLYILSLAALLVACAGEPPAEPAPAKPVAKPAAEQPLPAYMRALDGQLLGAPAGSDVELALLAVDTRDRPLRLLGSLRLDGTGTALPFRLTFNPEAFPQDLRVELRARVSQSGQLIQRLAPRRIPAAESQSLGALQLETVP